MTIIAYRDGVLAADSRVTEDGEIQGNMRKITKSSAGWLAGGCGDIRVIHKFLRWAEKNFDKRSKPKTAPGDDFTGIAISPSGEVFYYEAEWEATPYPKADFYTIGSGSSVCKGLLLYGAPVEEAARITCKVVTDCGEPIITLSHRD